MKRPSSNGRALGITPFTFPCCMQWHWPFDICLLVLFFLLRFHCNALLSLLTLLFYFSLFFSHLAFFTGFRVASSLIYSDSLFHFARRIVSTTTVLDLKVHNTLRQISQRHIFALSRRIDVLTRLVHLHAVPGLHQISPVGSLHLHRRPSLSVPLRNYFWEIIRFCFHSG